MGDRAVVSNFIASGIESTKRSQRMSEWKKQGFSKQDCLQNRQFENVHSVNQLFWGSGSRVSYLKIIPLEASFSCASDGAIDKLQSVK